MKKIIKYLFLIITIIVIVSLIINVYIIKITKNKIISIDELQFNNTDTIVVLGAGIRQNRPSPMLEDRLLTGIEIYNRNTNNKILLTGDHTKKDYDEVSVMKNYLLENNIDEQIIITDDAGISTYDSLYRVKNNYDEQKVIIVTQKYHLYRALYIAKKLDIDAYGIIANKREYQGQLKRDIREYIARIKDFLKCIIKPTSKYIITNI